MAPEDALARIGRAVKDALGDRTQAWLADQLGLDESAVSRIVAGRISELTVTRVAEIEDALGVARGALLRAGGLVAETVDVPAAIMADPLLDEDTRATMRAVYDLAMAVRRRKGRG